MVGLGSSILMASFFPNGGARITGKRNLVPPFSCASLPTGTRKWGGVLDRIYPGGVSGGIRGEVPSGQSNQDFGGLFRSRNLGRRKLFATLATAILAQLRMNGFHVEFPRLFVLAVFAVLVFVEVQLIVV